MSKAFDSILEGLNAAVAYAEGDKSGSVTHVVHVPDVDVKAARTKLRLTQDKFAAVFGISVSTLRKWEQGQRRPETPTRLLLNVIDQEPNAVLRTLASFRETVEALEEAATGADSSVHFARAVKKAARRKPAAKKAVAMKKPAKKKLVVRKPATKKGKAALRPRGAASLRRTA